MQKFQNYNRDEFANDLAVTPFHVASIFDDVDDQAWPLTKLQTDVIDIHAPVNQFHVRGGHVPYMTPQLRRATRHRNRLWKKYKLDPTTTNWNTYKRQRNYCTTLRRKAIINYYHHKAESMSTKPKDFWKVFGALFHSKHGQANDIVLLENNEYITDKKRMANIFNEYFINIGNDLPIPEQSQYVTLFGKTGLNENSVVMHFQCILNALIMHYNALIMVLNAFVMLFSPL